MPQSNDSILQAINLSKSFGGLKAVHQASIDVKNHSITGLIGPNGAGKSTLFNLLSNFLTADEGQVLFEGNPVQNLPPHQIARLGFLRTFQVARVLSRLTVLENMLLGTQNQIGEHLFSVLLQPKKIRKQERESKEKAMNILESVGLAEKAYDYAGALSGGQRKLLEMARTLMTNPKLILLDEPAAGVNPTLINQICEHILSWNQQGISFLIIEHNMDVIMSLCSHVWVLAEGTNLADGTPEEIQNNEQVLSAYLGE
ncbi:ABC transporter ATP-binding protein [Cyanobacterium aponinum UTEX 3222]|uniref:Neutral amino acid ABC transporter ATP-binding protein n=3 Tax=Cyanobacterium aponinum TaxID=379064 RepID=K9Z838_CYAAP|nr:ABC transporter ATP-binding protein [Cyanobacterium aponinum]WRL43499.1 ABC transporter ATP-binding protein [Cyanobacterium aponinum UTEX 3222]AFZ54553.1 neutral amino acid ABC transporter ATP-binding protein [Cyanobacterium aponinum PCC 10605]MBD2394671.1 ABC transporter ATP-binding protein [Cyanobacterium aponinum FACHB-4101]MTF40567.1 ATP-binding cassette domain-containing protein [Cyanobacterium aponinum 0216]PHV63813.1 ABC transporter ATP-binding protein [Cyanobacterium aponinum IPPAS 